jgi:ABC-type phosphate transport system substrate-binding protein
MNIKYCFVACVVSMVSFSSFGQIVVISGPNGPQLNQEKLSNGYLGKSFEFKPIDLPDDSATRDNFYRKLVGREPNQVKSVWARVVFAAKGQPPIILPNADAVKKAVATDPKAIGYIDKSAVDASVKVLLTLE